VKISECVREGMEEDTVRWLRGRVGLAIGGCRSIL